MTIGIRHTTVTLFILEEIFDDRHSDRLVCCGSRRRQTKPGSGLGDVAVSRSQRDAQEHFLGPGLGPGPPR